MVNNGHEGIVTLRLLNPFPPFTISFQRYVLIVSINDFMIIVLILKKMLITIIISEKLQLVAILSEGSWPISTDWCWWDNLSVRLNIICLEPCPVNPSTYKTLATLLEAPSVQNNMMRTQ